MITNAYYLLGMDWKATKEAWQNVNHPVQAVNEQGGFGRWHWDVSFAPSDVESKLGESSGSAA